MAPDPISAGNSVLPRIGPKYGRPDEPWIWTKARRKAAQLLCQGKMDSQAADGAGVSRMSLARWKLRDEFNEYRAELMADLNRRIKNEFLANKGGRLETLISDFNATSLILQERGVDCEWLGEDGKPRKSGAPGGSTGYLAREYQSRDTADVMHEGKPAKVTSPKAVYKFDSAIMRERRELRKQIAIELGEWEEVKIPDLDRLDEVLAVLKFAERNQGNDDADGQQ